MALQPLHWQAAAKELTASVVTNYWNTQLSLAWRICSLRSSWRDIPVVTPRTHQESALAGSFCRMAETLCFVQHEQGEVSVMLTYNDLPEIIHQRSRLAICAVLYELSRANFGTIRDLTGLSDGNLSKHLQLLESAGLVLIEKDFVERRPRTSVSLTHEGVTVFEAEIETLRAFVKTIDNVNSTKRSSSKREVDPNWTT